MHTVAAILVEANRIVIEELEIPPLKPGQVLVEIDYSGVCHTQVLEVRGYRGKDSFLPHCLGHEGSGKVVEIGAKVEKVKQGDHVILSWMKGSGMNVPGTVYQWKGQAVNAGAITTFSRLALISENRLTVLPKEFPLKEAALIGCALPTGLGAVFNTAQPRPGQSLAVFGCGGIGLCAIRGAAISGCAPIIAIDLIASKLETARQLGATHCIDASKGDPLQEIAKLGPLDFAIEASGSPIAMQQALSAVRPQGGTAVIVGNARFGTQLSIDPGQFNQGKRLLGTWGGDNQPDVHFPRYCSLIQHGHVRLQPFLNKIYGLKELDTAINDLEKGAALRPILDLTQV
jgi:S-(hydroxymethyl)glutathione dehydrogenase / alcohol dehydrogenase